MFRSHYSTDITKKDFNNLLKDARHHLAGRLIKDEPDRLEAYKLETDIMESYKHLHTLFRRIAKIIISIRRIDTIH